MRRLLSGITLAGVMLAAVATVPAGGPPEVRSILDKAIKAHGGETNLAKYRAVTMKGTGTFYGMGEGIPYTGEWAMQGPNQNRFYLESKVMDMSFKLLRVVNGDKGWIKFNEDAPMELAKKELDEEREQMHAGWVTRLVPLRDKSYGLAPLGDAKVDGNPSVGIRVSQKGRRDVNLYFDKASGLLVKSETRVKNVREDDKEYSQETYYRDYKNFQGSQYATKLTLHRDGKRFVEGVMSEIRPLEQLDAAVFAKP